MGNHSLRIKAAGIPSRLYRGKAALEGLRAEKLRAIICFCALNKGDIVNDCDGFNHVIKDYMLEFGQASWKRPLNHINMRILHRVKCRHIRGYGFITNPFLFEDGKIFCECFFLPEKALSREEIEAHYLSLKDNELFSNKKAIAHLRNGGHICDEQGFLLPEWQDEYVS